MSAPKTPRPEQVQPPPVSPALGFNNLVANLSSEWDLGLVVLSSNSPTKSELQQLCSTCISRLKHIFYKKAYEDPLDKFCREAKEQQNSWVYKPSADRDTLPSTSQERRKRRLQLLLDIVEPVHQRLLKEQSQRSRNGGFYSPLQETPQLRNDSAIPISPALRTNRNSSKFEELESVKKRNSSEFTEPKSISKRYKAEDHIFGRIDDVPVNTRRTPQGKKSASTSNTLLPKWHVKHAPSPRRESISKSSTDSSTSTLFSTTLKDGLTSMDTSFASDIKSSHLSQSFSQFNNEDFPSTALLLASVPTISSTSNMPNTPSSVAAKIKERLQGVFPILPNCLKQAPLVIRYEIVRIFLHTGVPLSTLDQSPISIPEASEVKEYEDMWKWLKRLPDLVGKKFPPKSDAAAWEMALGTFYAGFKRVHMSGALRASRKSEGPLFTFVLHELQTELGYRLGRRFGHDRFIDIKMPLLDDPGKLPKPFGRLLEAGNGKDQIIKWLHQGNHEFLGRSWEPFYVKDKAKKKGKQAILDDDETKSLEPRRICFFATSGIDFAQKRIFPEKGEPVDNHTKLTVEKMLNWLLSINKNGNQSFLKFYSRISLGLSATSATVVLSGSQIKKRSDDIRSKTTKEVMNDGCGLMSMALAKHISVMLRLQTVPSAFQGRIGEAKGLWIVDYFSKEGTSDKIWIETYPSQRKWEREDKHFGLAEEMDEDHRTFEVLKYSGPLKSASLTMQFLPLLEHRGVPREAISILLDNGLSHEIGRMKAAIDDPLSFRQWIGEQHPRVSERLKTGIVKFNGGRPDSAEETLTMLLDVGFDPRRFGYARELARKLFKKRCDISKEKLNIPVGLSTYAYIAVDFQGILAPDEIQLCFSTPFRDEISGKTLLEVEGMDVLIARSPAHFVSDIQRVRAVFKTELMKYKDVVILPSTGNSPLAGLLSGGDYDGDTVWLCFDQDIVQHFQNAKTLEQPDLLKTPHGNPLLRRDTTKFDTFLPKGASTFKDFLLRGFDFNFRNSYLGICTSYKDEVCYNENNVSSDTAVYLSTLLSCLVDQAKQGYVFDINDWQRFTSYLVQKEKRKRKPLLSADTRGRHIKDYLTKMVEDTTETALTEQYEALGKAFYFDSDLVQCAKGYGELAQSFKNFKDILHTLKADIENFKNLWSAAFPKRTDESKFDSKGFKEIVNTFLKKWQDIQPVGDPLAKAILLQKWKHADHQDWSLWKASLAYQMHDQGFIWWIAFRELCQLKGMANKSCNIVIPTVFATLKSDAHFIRMLQSEEGSPESMEAKLAVEEVEDTDYDEDDDDVYYSMDEFIEQ